MNQRVKLIRKELGMTQEQLAQHLGIGKAALSMIETGKAALSSRNRNILVQELNVNPDWLETGKGCMFNAEPDLTSYLHRTDNSLPLQSVPLYSIEGTAGLVPLFSDQAQLKPVNFIHIPNLPKCDGAIYIVGDSMYPLLKSGDIVLYKQLHDIGDVFWGDMYLLSIDIDGEEYVTVKYIQKSDRKGYVKLVSQNPHHADKEVEIARIRAAGVDREIFTLCKNEKYGQLIENLENVEDSASQMADFALSGQTVAQQITMLAGIGHRHPQQSDAECCSSLRRRSPGTYDTRKDEPAKRDMPRIFGAYLNYCRTERYFARTQRTIIELAWLVPPLETIGLPVAVFDHAR